MKRWIKAVVAGLVVAVVGVVLSLSPVALEFERGVGLPWFFQLRGAVVPPEDVVVVAIDGRTGENLGLPTLPRDWPRSIHATLIDSLLQRGAEVIVFDIHFGREEDPVADQAFVDAVVRAGNVVLVELLTGKRQPISDATGRHVGMVWEEELLPPFPALADSATGLATFPLPKEGASVSDFWVFKESTDNAPTLPAIAVQLHARHATADFLEAFAAATPSIADDLPAVSSAFDSPRDLRNFMRVLRDLFDVTAGLRRPVEPTPSADFRIPVAEALHAMYAGDAYRALNFYGPPGTIRTVPYHAVVKGEDPNVPAEHLDFTGKTVFVGYSDLFDPGQPDRFYTVFTRDDGVDLAGVEIAATGFANLLTNRSLANIDAASEILLIAAFGLVMGLVVYGLPAYVGVPIALFLAVAYVFAAQQAFNESALVMPIANPLLVQFPLALFIGLLGQYLLERRRGQRISEAINYYLPDDIAKDLTQDRINEARVNRVVFGTCLATDMAGFSTISEELAPGELAKFLNDYFETLAAPLKRHGVHVTEFRADAIMCAWTSDEPSPEPRRKALLASLEAGAAIEDFKRRHDMPGTRLRIGLEAGQFFIGHAGGGGRFVYSIVGDTANTASRIEGLNKHVGSQILATGEVVEGFENLVARYLGDFQFVGKHEAVPIYEVLGRRETADASLLRQCELFDEAMAAYRNADWALATPLLQRLREAYPEDGPAAFFLERSQRFEKDPSHADDPRVIRMTAK